MRFTHRPAAEAEANELLQRGEVQFAVTIPADFTRRLVRGERAADPGRGRRHRSRRRPAAPLAARAARHRAGADARPDRPAGRPAQPAPTPFEVVLQRRYNPEGITAYNIVPGLLAVILTMTLVMMTALAVTRERERGTMENLLAMPVRPIEVMVGKLAPYIAIGVGPGRR